MERIAYGPRSDTANRNGSVTSGTYSERLPNVVRDTRTEHNMTQKDLAELASVSALFVLRAEQYLHVELSDKLASALSVITNREPVIFKDNYLKGRAMFLRVNSSMLTENPYYRQRIRDALNYAMDYGLNSDQSLNDPLKHPFTLFRSYLFQAFDLPLSQIKFSAFTGIHPTVLANLENYKVPMEDSVKRALSVVLDMTEPEIATLALMCESAL